MVSRSGGLFGRFIDAVFSPQVAVEGSDCIQDETISHADIYIIWATDVTRQDPSPDIWDAARSGSSPG